jgi:hypothetical protein
MAKKKKEPNLDELDFRNILQEVVACSRLGRTLASFGATLTGREKQDANLVYLLLSAGKDIPERTSATAAISKDKKSKKYSPSDAIKWFSEKYSKEAEPLLAKLKETYDSMETAIVYGLNQGRELPDDYYVKVLIDNLGISEQNAAVLYHGVIKPQIQRDKEEEGLVRLVMK